MVSDKLGAIQLTDLGKLYLGEVTGALQSIKIADELVGTQSQAPTGTLRITAMPGYGERFVLPALERLRQLYPDIDFDVSLTDQVVNLSGNDVDIAIRAASTLPEQVVARRLGDHKFVLVASPEYLAQHGIPKTSTQLNDHMVFMYRVPYGILDWLVLRDWVWTAIDLKPKYVSNHGRSLLDSAIAGRGIAFLPGWGVAKDIEAGRLQILELEDGPLSVSGKAKAGMYLLYHPPKFRLQKKSGLRSIFWLRNCVRNQAKPSNSQSSAPPFRLNIAAWHRLFLHFADHKIPTESFRAIVDEAFAGERGKNFTGSKESFLETARRRGVIKTIKL